MAPVDHIGDEKPAPRKADAFAVTDDLAGLPVTEAELDVIEGFLMREVKRLLSADSKTTQTPAVIAEKPSGQGTRQ